MTENEIGKLVVDAAIAVHRELGPGLLETVYEVILAHELRQRGLRVERQVPISIEHRGIKFDEAFRADIVVEGKVVLELKSVEQ
jgi:GxxExxY protein